MPHKDSSHLDRLIKGTSDKLNDEKARKKSYPLDEFISQTNLIPEYLRLYARTCSTESRIL